MSLEWGYEAQRDLVTSMTYKRGTTVVAARDYTYDKLGSPITRQTTRQGSTVNDSFTYNGRNELTAATLGAAPLRLQLRQYRQPQDGAGTGPRTRLRGQRTQPVHRHPARERR